jgi:predicted DCC family thiol-disulfide oxidoreductase YuxK
MADGIDEAGVPASIWRPFTDDHESRPCPVIMHASQDARPGMPRPSSHYGYPRTLIFDGDCTFCQRAVSLLRRWDKYGRLRFVPFQDAEALAELPVIPRANLEQAMHLVTPNGDVYPGAASVPVMLGVLRWGRPLSLLFRIPGVPWLAARVYRVIARNRHRLGCGSSTCTLRYDGKEPQS